MESHVINWVKRLFGLGPKPTLEDEALQDAKDLEEQILNDELVAIDHRFKIDAHRAKQAHLLRWLERRPGATS